MANVPNLPGVPSLASYAISSINLLVADVVSAIFGTIGPQWGVFLDGAQVIPYNSILDLDYKQDWPIADYPIENGGFQSYDKVQLPFDIKVRMTSGPAEADRQALIEAVDTYANTLDLFDVVTPEQVYTNCCITHYDYKRAAHNGVGVIVMDVWFVEVRLTATSTYTTTQAPGVAGQQSGGNVSPTAAPAAFQSAWQSRVSSSGILGGS